MKWWLQRRAAQEVTCRCVVAKLFFFGTILADVQNNSLSFALPVLKSHWRNSGTVRLLESLTDTSDTIFLSFDLVKEPEVIKIAQTLAKSLNPLHQFLYFGYGSFLQ